MAPVGWNQIIQKGLKGHHRIHAIREKAIAVIDDHIEKEVPGNDPGEVPAMNQWQFYNMVTWYFTYHAASLNHRVRMIDSGS